MSRLSRMVVTRKRRKRLGRIAVVGDGTEQRAYIYGPGSCADFLFVTAAFSRRAGLVNALDLVRQTINAADPSTQARNTRVRQLCRLYLHQHPHDAALEWIGKLFVEFGGLPGVWDQMQQGAADRPRATRRALARGRDQ